MAISKLIERTYGLFARAADWLQPLILLTFRLTWGWQFFINGKGKLAHHADIVDFFTDLGIPFPDLNAWFVGGAEMIGGLLLMVGLANRPVALILTINMIVAYMSVESDRATVLNVFNKLDPFLQADPFFFLLTAVLVLAFGPGLFSLDALIAWYLKRRREAQEAEAGTADGASKQPVAASSADEEAKLGS